MVSTLKDTLAKTSSESIQTSSLEYTNVASNYLGESPLLLDEYRFNIIKLCLLISMLLLLCAILMIVWFVKKNRNLLSECCTSYYKVFLGAEEKVLKTVKKPIVKLEDENFLIYREECIV